MKKKPLVTPCSEMDGDYVAVYITRDKYVHLVVEETECSPRSVFLDKEALANLIGDLTELQELMD